MLHLQVEAFAHVAAKEGERPEVSLTHMWRTSRALCRLQSARLTATCSCHAGSPAGL